MINDRIRRLEALLDHTEEVIKEAESCITPDNVEQVAAFIAQQAWFIDHLEGQLEKAHRSLN